MARKREVDRPLRRDVRFLGRVLGQVLAATEGPEVFELEERIRKLAILRRRGPRARRPAAARELVHLLEGLPVASTEPIVRAFATYFALVNLAEQHHRVRRSRAHAAEDGPPQRGSLLAVLEQARAAGASADRARQAIADLEVTLTFTAHPTQAARRSMLEKLYRIHGLLEERDRIAQTPAEKVRGEAAIHEEIDVLWHTDELRRRRPTVGDEVKNVLWYVEQLWDLLPDVGDAIGAAFERAYGEPLGIRARPMRLHSWVGGDMDGNPFVTPEVLEDTIHAHHVRGLRRVLDRVRDLGSRLSQAARFAPPPADLVASLERDARLMPALAAAEGPRTEGEPWRRKLRFMEARVLASLARELRRRAGSEEDGADPDAGGPVGVPYDRAAELCEDLELVASSLDAARTAGSQHVRALVDRVRSAGFQLAELELRVPAADARDAAAWLDGKGPPTDGAARLLGALQRIARLQRQSGEGACRTLILSMTESAADVLAALRCARESGLWDPEVGAAHVDVVPLFETGAALQAAPATVAELFGDAGYRKHLAHRGVQEVMIGYSDSGKDVGLLAASAELRRVQTELPALAAKAGVALRIFHGRGESVARGGGPAQEAILGLPRGAVAGRYKATEQGEALDHKYARPELAMRTLELILGGAILHTLDAQPRPPPEDEARYEAELVRLGEVGRRTYRALVWENDAFIEFFSSATPIDAIARLQIGSRPSKRKAGGLEALRAIPWVFAWTQNRALLPGWYGVGSALADGDPVLQREMYERWPFFRAVIDNVEMVLAKSDLAIAARYAELAPPGARDAVWPEIRAEHARCRRAVSRVTGHRRLLEENLPLQRSIALRNPYVDPMSFLQVELLSRERAGDPDCERPLLLTLAGIASGMRNTG